MDRRLLVLSIGMFALGTDSFVVAGVLPEIARHFDVSIGAAGQMTTIYSVTFALLSPTIAALAAGVSRKTMLIAGAAVFVLLVGVASGRAFAIPWAIAGLGAEYAFALGDRGLDGRVPLYAVSLLVTAELAYWSVQLRGAAADEPGMAQRRAIGLLGDFKVTPVAIPGHTPGAMGYIFPVKDNGRTRMAALYGGTVLTPGPISDENLAIYLKSVDHFRNETKKAGVEVALQNHPLMLPLQASIERLQSRKKGDANPFVIGKANYQKFVDVMYQCSDVNIARRKAS